MATISFTTKFNLTLTPKQFKWTDTTDWAGQGILTSSVNGSFKVTAPSGIVVYNNTDYTNGGCDIRMSASLINQTTVGLPLAATGFPEIGTYTIVYTVYDSVAVEYYTITNTYTNNYVQPEVEITQTVDCLSPLFTSTDSTDYTVEGVDPVIVRTNTINYPYGSAGEGSPTIGSTATVTTSVFYQGTQTTEIESGLTYTFGDGLIVIDEVTGVKEALVDCADTCGIYCCVRALEQRMITERTTNTTRYPETAALFSQVMGLVGLVMMSIRCTKPDDVSGYLTTLKLLANCTDDCSCSGDEPIQVVGIGGLTSITVVDSADPAFVVVTPVVVGSTTTYSVAINPSFLTNANRRWVQTFVNAAARAAAVPDYDGQPGTQLDTETVYTATGLVAGNWSQVNFFKLGAGADSLMTKNATAAAGAASIAIGVAASSPGAASNAIGSPSLASGIASNAIGAAAVASGANSNAIGSPSLADGANSVAVGNSAVASGGESIAIGHNANVDDNYSIAIGFETVVTSVNSNAIGKSSTASGDYATAIGDSASATGANSNSIGTNSGALGISAIAIGEFSSANSDSTISIGLASAASGDSSISVGYGASSLLANSIVIGKSATASGAASTVLGYAAEGSGTESTALGNLAVASGASSVSIGDSSAASGANSVAVGGSSVAIGVDSIVVGKGSAASGINSVAIGTAAAASGNNSNSIGGPSLASGSDSTAIGTAAEASGANSIAIGSPAASTAIGSIAVGMNADASATGAVSVGVGAVADADSASAIGIASEAHGADSTAIGSSAIANIASTVNLSGTIITRKDSGETPYQQFFSGAVVTIATEEIDLEIVADYTITIPTGSMFFPDEVDLILTTINNVTGQPTIRAGGDVSTSSLLAAVATTALTAQFHRQRFETLLTSTGQATLTAGVTVAATGTTVKGRFVFRGILIENE